MKDGEGMDGKWWSDRFLGSRWVHGHANGVVTHGSTEPILTVLELRGFELRDFFLIGFNDNCGSILVETQERALAVKQALEPAYAVEIENPERRAWSAKFDRRTMDGTVPSWLITDITLKDGRKVMENGRWL
ncbi:hypothetical protein SEA_KRADAL_193 [Streptomyces phage Kradal]|nr:hypothetical protein SEA_KRADAL_193 [Streptomyces phage Kradal]QPL14509.1 hypothetical protein SEA_EHYELIMAYOE_194 [Streptomyces phage EhyElimayoE]